MIIIVYHNNGKSAENNLMLGHGEITEHSLRTIPELLARTIPDQWPLIVHVSACTMMSSYGGHMQTTAATVDQDYVR